MTRPTAVKRLQQFYEDRMTREDKNRDAPAVRELLDEIVAPLARTFLELDRDDPSREPILVLLADARDLRAREAWVKALRDYVPGSTEPQIRAAARALAATKLRDPDALEALLESFVRLEAGSPQGMLVYIDVKQAMTTLSSPSWAPRLVKILERPMQMLVEADRGNPSKITAYRNEQFWQVTAAEVLGNVRATEAARPLFKVVLDPAKADVAATAIMALVKLGPAVVPVLRGAVLGSDAEMLEHARGVGLSPSEARVSVVGSAALVLGTQGRRDAGEVLHEAWKATPPGEALLRTILAREIAKCPATADAHKAFVAQVRATPAGLVIPPGSPARALLIESLAGFYDPADVDVLIKLGDDVRGSEEDAQEVRDAAMGTIIKLMRADQLGKVERAFRRWAPGASQSTLEKRFLARAGAVLKECGDRVDCYLAKVGDPSLQSREEQSAAIKAATMVGVLGSEDTALLAARQLPSVSNAAVAFSLVQAIDHLTPRGSPAVAAALQRAIDAVESRGDRTAQYGLGPVRQVLHRVRARDN